MPHDVHPANPVYVLPFSLATVFQRSRQYPIEENVYQDGTVQNSLLANTSRKSWVTTKRLTAAQKMALLAFFNSRGGRAEEFYFYDVSETSPKYSYDETGVAATGRYIVRFNSAMETQLDWARSQAQFGLIEVE